MFEHDPESLRLDRFMSQRLTEISLVDRLALVRQLAEAMAYAHGKRLYHRGLAPQSVLVRDAEGAAPRLQITNWQVASRAEVSTTGAVMTAGTQHVEDHIADRSKLYLAPEAAAVGDAGAAQADVFSLGAIAYHLLSGRPPAASPLELPTRLREGNGLLLSGVMNGVGRWLDEMVRAATAPVVRDRPRDAREFLEYFSPGGRRFGDASVDARDIGGRSWKVTDVDWRRRTISVVPTEGGGRSRWLGAGRPMSSVVANAVERVVAGTLPGCRLSRRAEVALEQIRGRLEFVDGCALPLVAQREGHVTAWAFAGGAAMASIASGLNAADIVVTAFDDFSVTVRATDPRDLSSAIDAIDPNAVYPKLANDIDRALKFGLCVPTAIMRDVLAVRTSDVAAVAAARRRPRRLIRVDGSH